MTYHTPVYEHLTQMLGHPPTNVAADAAFDAWYVYDRCEAQGA